MGLILAGALWGFGEATLFFIVPDVLLTLIALHDGKAAARACVAAVAGALIGGLVMFLWGRNDPATATAVLDAVPAIDQSMIIGVRESLDHRGLFALFLGPATGTPYKIYAVLAGMGGLALPAFLLVSIPARGVRFALITAIAWWSSRRASPWTLYRKRLITGALWTAFYLWYFAVHT